MSGLGYFNLSLLKKYRESTAKVPRTASTANRGIFAVPSRYAARGTFTVNRAHTVCM